MPEFEITKSIEIKAPLEDVAHFIRTFKEWPQWSPWVVLEPKSELDFAEDGSSYSWEGALIGKGSIHLLEENVTEGKSQKFSYKLKLLKPFKSQSDVKFTLTQSGLYTKVQWHMGSSLPFFLFFLKEKVQTQCGMDFGRGLKMLKDLVENGAIHSLVSEKGHQHLPPKDFLVLKGSSSFRGLPQALKESFLRAKEIYNSPKIWNDAHPVVIYDKFDVEKELCVYRMGIPVRFTPDKEDIPSGFEFTQVEGMETFAVTHQGAYKHLGNAWALGMTLAEKKKFKLNKKGIMLEIYLNNPDELEEQDYLTEVHLPVA